MDSRFDAYRDAAGLEPALEFHSLRRSYPTHLIEDGHDPLFVQQQVGHDHASTTAICTRVSSGFRTRSLRRVRLPRRPRRSGPLRHTNWDVPHKAAVPHV
ncbi:tyrosine-type recombinase/integrase [Streptomyces sp. NPDC008313]|uniref:tyrosine-type recombinase/integrase n=1 Tax=Streptomyces sp. NPDC008313 TaxID=3364826 RepID=UPI0036E6179F